MKPWLAKVASAPGRFARSTWSFFNPRVKVGLIPFARTVLVIQLLAALIFVGYTLAKKGTRAPFSDEPYRIQVMLADAQGLNPSKEPAAGVAGVNAGKVTEAEVADNGQARVTLELDPEMRGKVFNDAVAFVRPTSVLQTLIVNVDPGTPEAGSLPDGGTIGQANTRNSVHIDELTGVLNADTQAQAQVLISEAARALRGREPELRAILAEVGELADTATPVAKALAERRRLLARLTDNVDALTTTLGQRGTQLADAIGAGSAVLEVTASRETELAEATRQLAPALIETERALGATGRLTSALNPALAELVPVASEIEPAAVGLRNLLPKLDGLVASADRLVTDGSETVRIFSDGLVGLADRIRGDQIPALVELVDLVELLFEYRDGLLQFAETFSGATSLNRNAGPYAQFAIVNAEASAEGFGFPASAARSRDGAPSKLGVRLAQALELTCRRENPYACVFRFGLPGLPAEPVLGSGGGD